MGNSTKEELQPIDGIEVIGDMTFAEKLQNYLDTTGRKPAELGRDASVSPSQISKYRSGEAKPSVPVILRISRATGIALEYWLDEEMTEPPRSELTADEAKLLWAVRALNMGAEEVLRRIERGKEREAIGRRAEASDVNESRVLNEEPGKKRRGTA